MRLADGSGYWPRLSSCDLIDGYPVEKMRRWRLRHRFQAARFPPLCMLAEQSPGAITLHLCTDAIRELLIAAIDDDAAPVALVLQFIDLEADLGVLPHPFDLLPRQGETVDIAPIHDEADRDYIGLIVHRTGKAAYPGFLKQSQAISPIHFRNNHPGPSV